MKKIFATAIISALAILPTFAAAQTAPATDNSALIAVLEQLVQVLTQEINQLLAKQAPATTTSSTTNQTFTTPSGAVIGADGSVLSAPTTPTVSTPTVPANTQTTAPTTSNNTTLSISLGQSTATTNSAYLSWNTNIPANSKVFLTQTPVASYSNSTQVISSVAGYSTQGFVNIPNLTPNTQYSYTIEATNGTQDQKLTGTLNTKSTAPTCPGVPTITVVPLAHGEDGYSGETQTMNGDTVTVPLVQVSDPTQPQLGYLQVAFTDACMSPQQLNSTLSLPSISSYPGESETNFISCTPETVSFWKPYTNNGDLCGASPYFNESVAGTSTLTITAAEPNGATATRTITIVVGAGNATQ